MRLFFRWKGKGRRLHNVRWAQFWNTGWIAHVENVRHRCRWDEHCVSRPNYLLIPKLINRAKAFNNLNIDNFYKRHEATTARHCGLRVLAFSLITNTCVMEAKAEKEEGNEDLPQRVSCDGFSAARTHARIFQFSATLTLHTQLHFA